MYTNNVACVAGNGVRTRLFFIKNGATQEGGGIMAYWPSSISQYASPYQRLHVVPTGLQACV